MGLGRVCKKKRWGGSAGKKRKCGSAYNTHVVSFNSADEPPHDFASAFPITQWRQKNTTLLRVPLFFFFFFFFCRAVCLFPPSSLAVSSLPLWNPVHFSRFFCLVRLSLAFFGPQNITVTTGGMSDEASRQLALEWLYEFCLVQCTNTMMANDPSYAGWGNIVERKQSLSHSGSRLTVAKKQKKKNTKTSTTSCQRWPRCAATSSSCARRLPS